MGTLERTSGVVRPPTSSGAPRDRRAIATLQYGPCWCRGIPGDSGSFDFIRQRRVEMDLGPLDANLVIVSERVLAGSGLVCEQVLESVPEPRLVIATATCPSAKAFWEEAPISWVPVSEVLPVDLTVDSCVSGQPEALLGVVLSYLAEVGAHSNTLGGGLLLEANAG